MRDRKIECRCLLYPSKVIVFGSDAIEKYKDIVPKKFIRNSFDSNLLKNTIEIQKKSKSTDPVNYHSRKYCVSLVFDKCGTNLGRQKQYRNVIFNGRHLNIMNITVVNNFRVEPFVLKNVDFVFLQRNEDLIIRRKLYELFGVMFNAFEEFDEVYLKLTENGCYMVILTRPPTSSIRDIVFWYKAKQHGKFRTCKDSEWSS